MVKIFIDPGHGGTDSGATGNGLQEKDVTLEIAKRVKKYLHEHFTGHEIKMSRDMDKTVSLTARTNAANTWGATLFLSIHVNAGGGTGFEDYIYKELADSSSTEKFRNILHTEIMKEVNPWHDRGKKKADFAVLRETKMKAILTENGFIDTKKDADKLKSSTFLNKLAKGHAEGIAKIFSLKRKTSTDKETFYRVIVGSYVDRKNAEAQVTALQKKGIDSFIDVYKK